MHLIALLTAIVAVFSLFKSILNTTLNPDHTLYWHSLPWFAHTDHWHIFLQVNTFFDSLFNPQASVTIFSRLPSLFPDLIVASFIDNFLQPLLSQDALVSFLVLNVSIIFLIVFSYVLVVLRQTTVSVLVTLSSLTFLHKALPFTNFIYIPIHHGGNVFNTLAALTLHLNACRLILSKRYQLAFANAGILYILCFVSTFSNKLFIFSALLPILCSSLPSLIRQHPLTRYSTITTAVGLSLAILSFFARLPLTQGRDSLRATTSQLVPHLLHVFTTSPAFLSLLLILLLNLVLASCLKAQYHKYETIQSFLLKRSSILTYFSAGLTSLAALCISIANNTYDVSRYLFSPLVLSVVLASVLLYRLISAFFKSNTLVVPMALATSSVLCLFPTHLEPYTFKPSPQLLTNEIAILDLIKSQPPTTPFGLATSPPWHATTLTALSNSTLTIREASSDGNPLFWHLWKGAFVNDSGYLRLLTGQNLGINNILPFSFVVSGPEEDSLIKPFFGSPSRSTYCQNVGYKCLHYYNDPSSLMINTAVFVNTYGSRPKT